MSATETKNCARHRITFSKLARPTFLSLWAVLLVSTTSHLLNAQTNFQYASGEIKIPKATSAEPFAKTFSLENAAQHIKDGAIAWSNQRGCISCHTNGVYLQTRPALTPVLGKPKKEMREFFVKQVASFEAMGKAKLSQGTRSPQIAYAALGLAEWDKHVSKKLSSETKRAISVLFRAQAADGSLSNLKCWPPLESSDYHAVSVAVMAIATAPDYLQAASIEEKDDYKTFVNYMLKNSPPHDYGRVLLLWASTREPLLADQKKIAAIQDMIFSHQNSDGGWAMRDFGKPETWGNGSRAKKLLSEKHIDDPPSDGHQTGLALLVLLESGIDPTDKRIQKGVRWIKSNQRESGRWWTQSMNTDRSHFITFSGTCYSILALHRAGELKQLK